MIRTHAKHIVPLALAAALASPVAYVVPTAALADSNEVAVGVKKPVINVTMNKQYTVNGGDTLEIVAKVKNTGEVNANGLYILFDLGDAVTLDSVSGTGLGVSADETTAHSAIARGRLVPSSEATLTFKVKGVKSDKDAVSNVKVSWGQAKADAQPKDALVDLTTAKINVKAVTTEEPPVEHTHTWGSPTYTWSNDNSTCTARRVCTDTECNEVASETVVATSRVTREPTTTSTGTRTYTALFTRPYFSTQVKNVTIPMLEPEPEPETYTVMFKANGGIGTMASKTANVGTSFALPAVGFTRDGYEFSGWNTKADGTGTAYADKATFMSESANATVVLYAQWTKIAEPEPEPEPETYTVTFDANGGTGTMAPKIANVGDSFAIPDVTFTRDKYEFSGWNTKADGTGTSYANKATFEGAAADSNVVLYAQWTKVAEPEPEPQPVEKTDISNIEFDSDVRVTYTGSEIKPTLTIVANGKELVAGTDYDVEYANNINAGEGSITITGKGDYTGTKVIPMTIAPLDITTSGVTKLSNRRYTGSEVVPSITFKKGGKVLTPGTDYDITWSDNVEIGHATGVITGKGNYTGTKNLAFDIVGSMDGVEVTITSPVRYTGNAVRPEIVVKKGDTTLVNGTDYRVVYENNTQVGEGKVTVIGLGAYAGTIEIPFTIAKAHSTMNVSISSVARSVTYNASSSSTISGVVSIEKANGTVTYTNASTNSVAKTFAVDSASGSITVPAGTKPGTYQVRLKVHDAGNETHDAVTKNVSFDVVVAKIRNTVKVTSTQKTVSANRLKTVAQAVVPLTVTDAKGDVTYSKLSGASQLSINKTTGRVTVAKGTAKGTYTMQVRVLAAGDDLHRGMAVTKTVRVVVK